jgi:PhnB protein
MKTTTYLNYGGNCAEALKFYEKHLGAKINMLMTHDQAPGATNLDPKIAKSVLYANMTLGNAAIQASDVPPERFQPMRSVYICLSVDSDAEAERIYKILTEGGEVYMAMGETFFATRFGQFRDKFGTSWMVIHERPMGPPPK